MLSRRHHQTAEQVVDPKDLRLLAIDVRLPSVRVVDLREHHETGMCIGCLVDQSVRSVVGEGHRGEAVAERPRGQPLGKRLVHHRHAVERLLT